MPWYRGVKCKSCKDRISLKRFTGPEEGPFDNDGPPEWIGGAINCQRCGQENPYGGADLIVFNIPDLIPGDTSEGTRQRKPN
jgi:hypothetical protein